MKKGLVTIKNKTAEAYRAYLADNSSCLDYHLVVKKESARKLKMLKAKAKAKAKAASK